MRTTSSLRLLLILILVGGGTSLPAAAAPSPDDAKAIAAAAKRGGLTWVGLSKAEAIAKSQADQTPFRVVREDGQSLPTTRDRKGGRVNASLWGGLIIHIRTEGNQGVGLVEGTEDPALLPWLGLTEAAAEKLAKDKQRPWRVVARDGEHFPVTMDLQAMRLNAVIVKGVVVAISAG